MRYKNFIEQPAMSFDFLDAQEPTEWDLNNLIYKTVSVFGKHVNRNKMFMATDQDIETLQENINPLESYIIYGFSRGGAAAINYLAKYNPHNIQALILEATPADMIDAINNFQINIGYQISNNRSTQELLFHTLFPAYQLTSKPPVENIQHILNKHLPIFIIHSKEDTRVPIDAAYKLYIACKDAGFTDVYLCILEEGRHAFYTTGNQKNIYLRALHSFYKKYNFVYDENMANIDDLSTLQPTKKEVEEQLKNHVDTMKLFFSKQNQSNQKFIQLTIAAALLLYGINLQFYQYQNLYSKNIHSMRDTIDF
jgi:predicted esterase